jgi:hypothetical protein
MSSSEAMETGLKQGPRGCVALNRAGDPCGAVARTGSLHCFAHSGEANMAELGQRGGRQRAANELELARTMASMDVAVFRASDVLHELFDSPDTPLGIKLRAALAIIAERDRLDEERRRAATPDRSGGPRLFLGRTHEPDPRRHEGQGAAPEIGVGDTLAASEVGRRKLLELTQHDDPRVAIAASSALYSIAPGRRRDARARRARGRP